MRIAVVGLFPKQFELVKARFPEVELIHVEVSGDRFRLPSRVWRFVVMTRFVGHGNEDRIRLRFKGARFVLCSGGLTTLEGIIFGLSGVSPEEASVPRGDKKRRRKAVSVTFCAGQGPFAGRAGAGIKEALDAYDKKNRRVL